MGESSYFTISNKLFDDSLAIRSHSANTTFGRYFKEVVWRWWNFKMFSAFSSTATRKMEKSSGKEYILPAFFYQCSTLTFMLMQKTFNSQPFEKWLFNNTSLKNLSITHSSKALAVLYKFSLTYE